MWSWDQEEFASTGALSDPTLNLLDQALAGSLFLVLLGAATAVYGALLILLPYTFSFSFVATFASSVIVTAIIVDALGHSDAGSQRVFSPPGILEPEGWPELAGSLLESQPEWSSQTEFLRDSIRILLGALSFFFGHVAALLTVAAIIDAENPITRGQKVGLVVSIIAVAITVILLGGLVTNEAWVLPLAVIGLVLGIISVILSALSIASLTPTLAQYEAIAATVLGALAIVLGLVVILVLP